jgi:hypothetical protein
MMASETATSEKADDKSAGKTERREARLQRQAEKAEKRADKVAAKSDRPLHICSLSTVDVRKSSEGYQVAITSSGVRRTISLAPHDVGQVLKDLETAILVIRSQQ